MCMAGGGGSSKSDDGFGQLMQMMQYQEQKKMQENEMANARATAQTTQDQYEDNIDKQKKDPAAYAPSDSASASKKAASQGTRRFLIPIPTSGANTPSSGSGLAIPS